MTLAAAQTPTDGGDDWQLDAIVARLRDLRERSLAQRQRTPRPARLPSRAALIECVELLIAALFPHRMGPFEFSISGTDHFVGHTLDRALRLLTNQVERELYFIDPAPPDLDTARAEARRLVANFAQGLPAIREMLDSDIDAAFEGDPAARSVDEILACYPGVTAIIHHRLAHLLLNLGAPLVARMIAAIAHATTAVDIHPGAQIGRSFFIDHGTGVVIGETTVIGQRVRLYQAVTLGAKRFPRAPDGTLIKGIPRHPIVEDDVVVYAGATILGRITIGRGSSIGGNVWLTHSVPPGSQVSQGPSRADAYDGGGGI